MWLVYMIYVQIKLSIQAGVNATLGLNPYGIAKKAVIGMTQILALEHIQDKIRVNTVCPAAVMTPMIKAFVGKC